MRKTATAAPFLKVALFQKSITEESREQYPYNLQWARENVEFRFSCPVTILIGENGSGKSSLLEALAAHCGYDEAGGGQGYRPVDHSHAVDRSGAGLAQHLRLGWLPRVTNGWFFRAESFFSVARYLDDAALSVAAPPPDLLSASHGEGFIHFFEQKLLRRGTYFLDEPESALSPARQIELLRILHKVNTAGMSQIILATHSPILMALPSAQLVTFSPSGFAPVSLDETEHFKIYDSLTSNPERFLEISLNMKCRNRNASLPEDT